MTATEIRNMITKIVPLEPLPDYYQVIFYINDYIFRVKPQSVIKGSLPYNVITVIEACTEPNETVYYSCYETQSELDLVITQIMEEVFPNELKAEERDIKINKILC